MLPNAGLRPFSEQLLGKNLILLWKMIRSPGNTPLRRDTFVEGSIRTEIGRFIWRQSRLRHD